MKVIILAAGKGNRLMPLTAETPKPLIEIAGLPIIDRIFMSLPDEIDEAIIVVEHLKDKIKNHVGDFFYECKIKYIDQIKIRGTFGALLSAKDLIDKNERFLILNGDDIHDKKELLECLNFPRAFGLQKMQMLGYHSIHLDNAGFVEGFYPQTNDEKENGTLIATGAYVADADVFKHPGIVLRDGECGLPQTLLAQKDTHPIKGIITEKWIPVNSFADIENADNFFKK